MKILIFTEGTIIMHLLGKNVSRKERVKQSRSEGIQREERNAYKANKQLAIAAEGSVYDFENYIPIGGAVEKIISWGKQGSDICYLTSRRIKSDIETIKSVLTKFSFPSVNSLYFRKKGEDYKDVVERIVPDILIEDDCESIGGEKEMCFPYIRVDLKKNIKLICVKEFGGINHLASNILKL